MQFRYFHKIYPVFFGNNGLKNHRPARAAVLIQIREAIR